MVVDPSSPIGVDGNGQMMRTLTDDESTGSVVAGMLPAGGYYVKAFGTRRGRLARKGPEPRTSAGGAVLRRR